MFWVLNKVNSSASVQVHGTSSRLAFEGLANLEFGSRKNVVPFGELVHFFDPVNTI